MPEFRMPSLGADMESGTLLQWRVSPGDEVHRGDIVAVVDTSKAEIEVEVFEDGVVEELLVPAGTRVPVGTVLATLRAPGEPAAAPRAESAVEQSAPRTPTPVAEPTAAEPPPAAKGIAGAPPSPEPEPPPEPKRPHEHLRVSPVARRAAERLGVDLASVTGTGPGGAIGLADVEQAASAPGAGVKEEPRPGEPAAQPSPGEPLPVLPSPGEPLPVPPPPGEPAAPSPAPALPTGRQAAMRAAIGALMARSKREIPHYYLQSDIDLDAAMCWLSELNAERPMAARVLPAALLLAAVARAAREMPAMNGFFLDGFFQPAERVHLGVAVSLRGGGLVAPAIHDADALGVERLMEALRELVRRARAGSLRSSEMSDPTITVTNLGDLGADAVHGVIYPPQVALVGFGAIRERPWAHEGMLAVRPLVTATLAGDHRAGDGADGSRFLALVERRLQRPQELAG